MALLPYSRPVVTPTHILQENLPAFLNLTWDGFILQDTRTHSDTLTAYHMGSFSLIKSYQGHLALGPGPSTLQTTLPLSFLG